MLMFAEKGRNEVFLEEARKYAMSILGGALVIRILPNFLIPVVGRLVGLKCKWQAYKVESAIRPIIRERLDNAKRKKADSSFEWKPPVRQHPQSLGALQCLIPPLVAGRWSTMGH